MQGHFNPGTQDHAGPSVAFDKRHRGAQGNVVADATGTAVVWMEVAGVSLKKDDPAYIVGRGIVVHAGEDDLGLGGADDSLTTGNAGARVSCCVITAVDNEAIPENGECRMEKDEAEGEGGKDDPNDMDCAEDLCCGTVYDSAGAVVNFDNGLPISVCQKTTATKMWLPDEEPTWNSAVKVIEYDFKCEAGTKLLTSLAAFAFSALAMY